MPCALYRHSTKILAISRLTGRKPYGHTTSLDAAKAAFRAEYEAWQSRTG
jgi:hypothetical protein